MLSLLAVFLDLNEGLDGRLDREAASVICRVLILFALLA